MAMLALILSLPATFGRNWLFIRLAGIGFITGEKLDALTDISTVWYLIFFPLYFVNFYAMIALDGKFALIALLTYVLIAALHMWLPLRFQK